MAAPPYWYQYVGVHSSPIQHKIFTQSCQLDQQNYYLINVKFGNFGFNIYTSTVMMLSLMQETFDWRAIIVDVSLAFDLS